MNALMLDTHAWLWWVDASDSLPKLTRRKIDACHEVCISAISCWEVGMLIERGRLRLHGGSRVGIRRALDADRLRVIPVNEAIAVDAGLLGTKFHGDPADRIIAATAQHLGVKLVTKDERIREAGVVDVVW